MAERFKAVVLKTTGGLRLPWVRIPPPPPIPDAPRLLASLLACLGLAACGGAGGSAVGGCPTGQVAAGATCSVPGPVVSVWVTWPDRSRLVARDADLAFLAGTAPAKLISVDPATRFQSMVGFGATLTDASALNLTTHLADPARAALLAELFGRTGGGLGLSFMRLPIGASDFSTSRYTFDDMPAGQVDDALAAFSIAPLQSATLPLLKAALAANPSLRIMATPWSPPAWMKTNDSLVQVAGITATLRPAAYGAFARYLGRFADAMEAEGVPLYALSLQNEPGYEPPDYPGMRLDTFETDPGALKVPFFHNNDDYDEVIFYHAGDFFSRDNIHPGMVTFHPAGFTHGPHPKALSRMLVQTKPATEEYAVMIDTRDALEIGDAAAGVEWPGYVDSWKGGAP